MARKSITFMVLIGAALITTVALKQQQKPNSDEAQTPLKLKKPTIKVVSHQVGKHTVQKIRYGKLTAMRKENFISKVNGEVKHVFVHDGETIQASQPLIEIRNEQLTLTLSRLDDQITHLQQKSKLNNTQLLYAMHEEVFMEHQLKIAQDNFMRTQKLGASQHASTTQIEQAKQNVLQTNHTLNGIRKQINTLHMTQNDLKNMYNESIHQQKVIHDQLKDYHLNAPFTGIVPKVRVTEGQHITPGMGLVDIFSPKTMRLEVSGIVLADVPYSIAKDFTKIKVDHKSFGVSQFYIAKALDPHEFAPTIQLELPYSKKMILGQTYEAILALDIAQSLSIPKQYVYNHSNIYVKAEKNLYQPVSVIVLGYDIMNINNMIVIPKIKSESYQVIYDDQIDM